MCIITKFSPVLCGENAMTYLVVQKKNGQQKGIAVWALGQPPPCVVCLETCSRQFNAKIDLIMSKATLKLFARKSALVELHKKSHGFSLVFIS